jgi:hypothetical protein
MLNSPIFSPERQPVSRVLTLALIIAAVLAAIALHLRSGVETGSTTWILAAISITLVTAGWFVLDIERKSELKIDTISDVQTDTQVNATGFHAIFFSKGMLLVFAGTITAFLSRYLNDFSAGSSIAIFTTFFAIGLYDQLGRKSRIAGLILAPILCGSLFTGVAGVLGNPIVGIFPGVISLLFVLVLRVTLDIEREIISLHRHRDDEAIFHLYRRRLAWTAGVFFLFGVVSFWPWLGSIYGQAYFWILIIGVILPLVFFWGRLRQPRDEGAQVALTRFNRISPIVAFALMLAFAIG